MRIGFDARYVNDRYHGIGRYAYELIMALTQRAPDQTFVIFQGKSQDSRFDWRLLKRQQNVEFHAAPWPLYWPHEQLIWPFTIRNSEIDIFHSPFFVAPLFASARLPILITVHDLIFDRYPEFMPESWGFPYYRLIMRLSTRRATRVVAVSNSTARDLITFYTVPDDHIAVVPDGIELKKWEKLAPIDLQIIRQKYHLNNPFILSIGARRPHKNNARLVQAFHSIQHQLPHDLVFAGSADRRFNDDAKLAASKCGLNGRVRFLDWVPEIDLPALYQLADIVAQPSLIEGFGLPALEAMASGTAVLAANNSSLPEVVGDAGILVDPYDVNQIADTLLHTLHIGKKRERLEQAGKKRAREFNWESIADRILQIYQHLIA